ncbi:cell division protein FtsZ [Lutibacter sp.]|uniref:cell division protein FtsZ n=1 Tax=Lutibacter sp. TaxID=1925666 RepID=UPI0025BCBDB2|nr:cell division protein FtsZ [Lutibacter sp.]MCF6180683.1 cell division protein FtsZ [Lutibacter sp.]
MSNSDFNNISFDLPKNKSHVIKVIGVGGGGSNAVNHMFSQGINGVDFIICNTDAQALQNSPIPTKIQLGVSLTEGLGAGANPEVGEQAAMESIQEIREMLSSHSKMVFITVGMGGGTGTGAAPVIAKVARELDLLTIGIVTTPFSFEGKTRNEQAQKGIDKLREYVDSLVVINNNKLREVYGNLGFKAGFSKADEVLSTAARGIAEVITHHYTQNIDLKDAKTVLSNSGTAIMGSASAAGVDRSEEAITKALDSPLLNDNKITGAKNVLLLIVSGTEEITIDEIGEINDYIQSEAKSNVNIIMGVGEDESLGDAISVTIIATGFTKDQQYEIANTDPKIIKHILNDEQEATFDFNEKTVQNTVKIDEENKSEETFINEDKIIYDLGEDLEEEVSLIPTTEFIKNIDIVYDEVLVENVEEFEITEIKSELIEEKEEPIEDENQISFTFDLPIKEAQKITSKNSINAEKFEVNNHEIVESSKKVEEEVYFSLEDYTELEDNLTKATKPKAKVETVIEEELKFTLSSKEEINNQEVVDYKEVSPLDLTIEELQKRASERRDEMKNFNYKFINNIKKKIDDIEKEPAYKRMGVELNETTHSSEINQSRTSLEVDENDNIQFRSNNSFLHDNVD